MASSIKKKKFYSESTANFCEWLNDLFDAINRNKSFEGVICENKDYKVSLICKYYLIAFCHLYSYHYDPFSASF